MPNPLDAINHFLSGTWGRFVRSSVSWGLGFLIAKYKDNPWYLAASPLLQTSSKWLRDKYPGEWEWLPF